jgi:hypothetical protein
MIEMWIMWITFQNLKETKGKKKGFKPSALEK